MERRLLGNPLLIGLLVVACGNAQQRGASKNEQTGGLGGAGLAGGASSAGAMASAGTLNGGAANGGIANGGAANGGESGLQASAGTPNGGNGNGGSTAEQAPAGASGSDPTAGAAGGDDPACQNGCPTRNIVQLTTGDAHTCALLADHSLKCWGNASFGALGYGPGTWEERRLPNTVGTVPVSSDPQVYPTQIAAGAPQTCARLSDGSLKCWGSNGYGACGNGIHDDNGSVSWVPGTALSVTNEPGVTVKEVAAGNDRTCVILSNGGIKCWGNNQWGQLGYGNLETIGDDELPSAVGEIAVTEEPGVKTTQLALGFRHTCALLANGSVKCWGEDFEGQLGLGKYDVIGDDELPSAAPAVSLSSDPSVKAVQIAAGYVHTCALMSDGSVRCWGASPGIGAAVVTQIGDDELPSAWPAVAIGAPSGVTVTQIVAAGWHTCVRLSDGTAKCWGQSEKGELGYGNASTIGDDESPASVAAIRVTVDAAARVASLSAGIYTTCAVLSDGTGKCWGSNRWAQLGLEYFDDIGDDELPASIDAFELSKP